MTLSSGVIEDKQEISMQQVVEVNPRRTKPLSVTRFTKGVGYHLPVNLKTEPQDTSYWYHSIAMGLFFHIYQNKYKYISITS